MRNHWMPFTAVKGFEKDPRTIVGAQGVHLIDDRGRQVFDSLSGLWCCGFGHNRPEIIADEEQLFDRSANRFFTVDEAESSLA